MNNAKPNDVAAFGRATIDLYANEIGPMEDAVTFSKYVGGSPANTAIAMARLGLRVGYVGKVSDDQFGRFITRHLGENGVDVSHIAVAAPGIRSGVTMGEIRPDGCAALCIAVTAPTCTSTAPSLMKTILPRHKLLLVSGTSLSHSPAREAVFLAIEYARRNGVRVSFDLDYREGTWNSPEEASVYFTLAARQADMVLGTREEFDMMERVYHPGNRSDAQSAQWLLDAGRQGCFHQAGQKGSFVYTKDGRCAGGIYPAKVLKTFGARRFLLFCLHLCTAQGQGHARRAAICRGGLLDHHFRAQLLGRHAYSCFGGKLHGFT